jgi:hypothetical protein
VADDFQEGRSTMIFETKIRELSDQYLADAHVPDITGFVDQLFHLAAETGAVACELDGENRMRFSLRRAPTPSSAMLPVSTPSKPICNVEHVAARAVLRMMCARLAVVLNERSAREISAYGDQAEVDYDIRGHRHWSISFSNTPERQRFQIEAM